MNKVFLNAIENLDHSTAMHVKKSVEREARQKEMLKHVDAMLKKEQILGRGQT